MESNTTEPRVVIEFGKEFPSYPDHRAEAMVQDAIANSFLTEQDIIIRTSTEAVVVAATVMVAEGSVRPWWIIFRWRGQEETPDRLGRLALSDHSEWVGVRDSLELRWGCALEDRGQGWLLRDGWGAWSPSLGWRAFALSPSRSRWWRLGLLPLAGVVGALFGHLVL